MVLPEDFKLLTMIESHVQHGVLCC